MPIENRTGGICDRLVEVITFHQHSIDAADGTACAVARALEKPGQGGYRRSSLVSTFAAAFPMDRPRFVVIAMLDEPKGTASSSFQRTAAWNAAPIVGRVVPRIGPLLGVMPDASRDIDLSDLKPLIGDGGESE